MKIFKDEIELRIKHRYENFLIDEASIDAEKLSFKTTIKEDDTLNRQRFFRKKSNKCMISGMLLEVLALGTIVVSDNVSKNDLVVFAGASNLKKESDFLINDTLEGVVKKEGEKGQFFKFSGQLFNAQKKVVFSSEITAFFLKNTNNISLDLEKGEEIPSAEDHCIYKYDKKFEFKDEALFICDYLVSATSDYVHAQYTFPLNHFCNKGHFPGNPMMMGVLQLTSLEDVLLSWLNFMAFKQSCKVTCRAELKTKKGTLIAKIKGASLQAYLNHEGIPNQCELISVKKVTFLRPVKPEDQLNIYLDQIKVLD